MRKEFIGKGANWKVYRIKTSGCSSKIHKHPLKNQNTKKNINNYKLVFDSGLPTLKYFHEKKLNGKNIIEAEDLNPDNCNGYFVSPNTVRNSSSCASKFMEYLKDNTINKPKECNEFDFSSLIENLDKIDHEKLSDIKLLSGAEKYVYENKISEISNFNNFLRSSKADMENAAKYQLGIFTDAFFFRVSDTSHNIEYKIADFDCIEISYEPPKDEEYLKRENIEYFKTALLEFIMFFVEENKKSKFIELIERL